MRPFECVIEGVPVSANNDRRAARRWRAHVAETAAGFLSGWQYRTSGELSAHLVMFHTGTYKGDTDNIPKHVLDALKGLVYDDDRLISHVTVRRTAQGGGLELVDPPVMLAGMIGQAPDFLYVRIGAGPDHRHLPWAASLAGDSEQLEKWSHGRPE